MFEHNLFNFGLYVKNEGSDEEKFALSASSGEFIGSSSVMITDFLHSSHSSYRQDWVFNARICPKRR
jgi:hypothetical protein